MNINKAIRKQKKSFKRFVLSMSFIFFMLPIVVVLNERYSPFIIIYLVIIEVLILISILIHVHGETLKFQYVNKLKIQNGILGEKYTILCDKVIFVHAVNDEKDMKIIMILKSRMRNQKIKIVDIKFLKRYTLKNGDGMDYCIDNLENKYYYVIISKGGYYKYELLNVIYRYCVKAHFTDQAIEKIKEYRN